MPTKLTVRNDCPWYGTEFRLSARKYPRQTNTYYNRCALRPGHRCQPTAECSKVLDTEVYRGTWSDLTENKHIQIIPLF